MGKSKIKFANEIIANIEKEREQETLDVTLRKRFGMFVTGEAHEEYMCLQRNKKKKD